MQTLKVFFIIYVVSAVIMQVIMDMGKKFNAFELLDIPPERVKIMRKLVFLPLVNTVIVLTAICIYLKSLAHIKKK